MNSIGQAEASTLKWLLQAYSHGIGGFPHSRWICLPGCCAWSRDYPETTGYIIENLLEFNNSCLPGLSPIAESAGEWLLRVQSDDGYFHSGTQFKIPSVFNTAQILFGLHQLYLHTRDNKYKASLTKAFLWLIQSIDDKGTIRQGLYSPGFYSAYYARALWPMLMIDHKYADSEFKEIIEKSLDLLLSYNTSEDTLKNMGFFPDKPALLHTVIYALEGFYECSLILEKEEIQNRVQMVLSKFVNRISQIKKTPGRIYKDFSFDTSFICVTGQAQLCALLLKVYTSCGNPLFKETACFLFDQLLSWQNQSDSKEHHGAFPSSIPIWGPYFPLRYTNWTMKFFLDACYQMKLHSQS